QNRVHSAREEVHRVINFGLVAFAVTRKINGDDPGSADKCRNLSAPEAGIAGPPMNEYKSFRAFTVILVMDRVAIELRIARLSINKARWKRELSANETKACDDRHGDESFYVMHTKSPRKLFLNLKPLPL